MTLSELPSKHKEIVRHKVTLKVFRVNRAAVEKKKSHHYEEFDVPVEVDPALGIALLKGHLMGYSKNEKNIARLAGGAMSTDKQDEEHDRGKGD